eukprot:SAG11_NODE_737_length_7431_cov_7.438762_5_plen_43_part_00
MLGYDSLAQLHIIVKVGTLDSILPNPRSGSEKVKNQELRISH